MLLRALIGATGLVCLLFASPALAQDKKSPQEEINEQSVTAQAFEKADKTGLVTQDVGLLRAWIGEAQAHLAQGNDGKLNDALRRVRAQSTMIEALLAQAAADQVAREAHARADAREAQLAELTGETVKMEQRQEKLSAEGL